MTFSGFGRGMLFTPVPNAVLGPLLEQIQDAAELKVTLRSMWLFHRKRGRPQVAALNEFLNDPTLLKGLGGPGRAPREEIRRGLELAVSRGTLLMHQESKDDEATQAFILNTDAGRRILTRLRRGEDVGSAEADSVDQELEDEPVGAKPNIFALYEDNIGTMSPMLAEHLREAESAYPEDWINDAFQIAVAENKRNWRYIAGILRRWAAEGKDHGKPGRHSQKDSRQKYLEAYQRRWGLPTDQGSRR